MEPKKIWQSKTFWVNLVVGLAGVLIMIKPEVAAVLTEANTLMAISVVNIVLRLLTKTPVEIA